MISRKNNKSRNNAKSTSPMLETLESRRLMSVNLVGGQLLVTGTESNDFITIGEGSNKITVTGATPSPMEFSSSSVAYISVFGHGGADNITVDANKYALVSGGAGNDILAVIRGALGATKSNDVYGEFGDDMITGSYLNDLLNGGEGNDIVRGYGGDDLIYGAGGIDKIYGGAGNDRLHGDGGVDYIYAEAGDDNIFVSNDNARDYVDGGLGYDTCYHDVHWLSYYNDSLINVENKIKD